MVNKFSLSDAMNPHSTHFDSEFHKQYCSAAGGVKTVV